LTSQKKGRLLWVSTKAGVPKKIQTTLADLFEKFTAAQNGVIALQEVGLNDYQVVIIDDRLPYITASQLIEKIHEFDQHLPIIALVESKQRKGEIGRDFNHGLFGYLESPLQAHTLKTLVEEALNYRNILFDMNVKSRAYMTMRGLGAIMGRSAPMVEIYKSLLKILDSDVKVAIFGESGTGKEMVARFLHLSGSRHKHPFVSVNCAAIPSELLESELFGYEKGAFTGAAARKKGKFEVADKGTFFLDEIGDMSLPLQAKILKVIEHSEFERVGGTETIEVDVRIISATHRNLVTQIQKGKFREDLFHRINVFPFTLPPLRERLGDIPILAYHILNKAAIKTAVGVHFIESDALAQLSEYSWKGNVRELENALERANVLSENVSLTASDFDFLTSQISEIENPAENEINSGMNVSSRNKVMTLKEMEKYALLEALERNQGTLAQAARELGISRMTLYRKLKQYGIKED